MSGLLRERTLTSGCEIGKEEAIAFMNAVLDLSSDISAFLDAEKHPILCKNNFSDQTKLSPSDICSVNDRAGNLIGFVVREKKNRGDDRDFLTGAVILSLWHVYGEQADAPMNRLVEEFNHRIRTHKPGSEQTLLFLDLDRFKPVNEHFGHLVGDQILLQFAVLLKNTFRSCDCVARYGGDEFVILCDCSIEVLKQRVERFRKRLDSLFIEVSYPDSNSKKGSISLSFSYGLTRIIPEDTLQSALHRADTELLQMKKLTSR